MQCDSLLQSCCCSDFPDMMHCQLKPWAQISPFSFQLLPLGHFINTTIGRLINTKGIIKETSNHIVPIFFAKELKDLAHNRKSSWRGRRMETEDAGNYLGYRWYRKHLVSRDVWHPVVRHALCDLKRTPSCYPKLLAIFISLCLNLWLQTEAQITLQYWNVFLIPVTALAQQTQTQRCSCSSRKRASRKTAF